MQRLLLLGMNHTTAPLEVRERLAFSPQQQKQAIEGLRRRFPTCEVVLISTCNRVEMYVAREVHGHPRAEEMVQFLGDFHHAPVEQFRPHLYEKSDRQVVAHLFTVAASLDSMVIGESQILGQVRQAYDLARELKATGSVLNPLFQRAIAVGKEVLSVTSLGEGRVSVAGVAVAYARRIFDRFDDKTVLCIGAGKMAALALRGLAALKPGRLVVCNRDAAKADELAARVGGIACGLEALELQLSSADIVIASTGCTQPLITRSQIEAILRQRRYRPVFMLDIAVPRNIEASVGDLEQVYLYNIDDLQQTVQQTYANRSEAINAARSIVDRHVNQFVAWDRQRRLGPLIDRLYKRLHEVAAAEVARTINKLPELDESEKSHLEDLARRIVNKLLHEPLESLRQDDDSHSAAAQYLSAIAKIFGLEEGCYDESSRRDDRHQ